jgi:hypothetical protein
MDGGQRMLPLWVQSIQAILLVLISCLGAWIAYKQVKIATAKLNLDLYDKRFEVFEGARSLLLTILQDANVSTGDVITFNTNITEAVFLFEADVRKYLDGLRERALALHTKNEQLRAMREEDKRRDALIDGIAALETEFASEYERLEAAFRPYLKLGNI